MIKLLVSNIEQIQSQLKNIYINTLSTLSPLPWLDTAEDTQFNFDDVFIPLRTIDIAMQQQTRTEHTAERRTSEVVTG